MASPRGPQRPAPPQLRLPELADTALGGESAGDVREGERYADADLTATDLTRTTFRECSFERVALHEADLRGVHLVECRLTGVDAAVLSAPRSSWRTVEVSGSRWGAVEAYETTWRSVTVSECKLGYLNARASTWTDVTLVGCHIEELDLAGATLTRVALPGCRVGTLRLGGATLTDVDLRETTLQVVEDLAGLAGAWVSESQLVELAPLLADHLKIRVG